MADSALHVNMGKRFQELTLRPQGVFGFGVATPLDAYLAVQAGVECIYAGGYSIALSQMQPDMGRVTMIEQRDAVMDIVRASAVPVIADIDDGYGGVLNVHRTAEEFFGRHVLDPETNVVRRVAGVHIEDQRFPKRCGHIAGKELVPIGEMVGKLQMLDMVRAAVDPDIVIIARTDAYNSKIPGSLDEAVMRAVTYAVHGADYLWAEFNTCDRAPVREFAERVRRALPGFPLAFNYSPSLSWSDEPDPMDFSELNAMGYKFIFVTIAAAHATMRADYDYARDFCETGVAALWEMQKAKRGHPTESHHLVARVPFWQELERRFAPEAAERQERGEGFGSKDNK